MRITVLPFTLALLLHTAAAWSAPQRVAVIGNSEADKTVILLSSELQSSPDVALVERERLAAVADEQALQRLLDTQAERSRVGTLLSADVLALVSVAGRRTEVVVVDTKLGATLGRTSLDSAPNDEKAVQLLAKETLAILSRFRDGVRFVVAVPDFVSRDLTFERKFLQFDYAEVIRSAYRQIPGVALVAVDEAQAIAGERQVGDAEQGKRVVPLFVEGEFRHTRGDDGAQVVRIIVRATDGTREVFERSSDPLKPEGAGAFLLDTFAQELLGRTSPPADRGDALTPQRQFELLIARADAFAQVGEFRRSALLREAALLVNPDATAQRKQLIREYTRRNRRPYESGEEPPKPGTDAYAQSVATFISDWTRSLHHCEYLIRNRRISREEATDLTVNAVESNWAIQVADRRRELAECEAFKKQFVREAFARIATLEPYAEFKKRVPDEKFGMTGMLDVYHAIIGLCITRCDGPYLAKEDLDLLAELLTSRLPESMWPVYRFNFFMRETAVSLRGKPEPPRFSAAEYLEFLDRLTKSDRPLVRIYGRYGTYCYQRYAKGQKSPEMLAEARSIVADAERVGFDTSEYSYYLGQLRDEVAWVKRDVEKPRRVAAAPVAKPPVAAPPAIPPARVKLELIPIALETPRRNETSLTKATWRSPGGWTGATHFRPLGQGLDVFWARGALLFMEQPGVVREVLADEKLSISDVVTDGKYVWVAAAYGRGVYVLDRSGKRIALVDKSHGLPPTDVSGPLLHPLQPGRVMATGSFGNTHRGWIATIDVGDDAPAAPNPKVDVFHEGTIVPGTKPRTNRPDWGVDYCFQPNAIFEHPAASAPPNPPRRLVFVVTGLNPLVVDVATKKVTRYVPPDAKDEFPRWIGPLEAYASIDGVLWVAGSQYDFNGYRLTPQADALKAFRNRPDWHMPGLTDGSLARDGDWLYYAGSAKWRRINLKTLRDEVLIDDSRQLPHPGSGRVWVLAASNHFGLVAFTGGELYRVTVSEPGR